MSDDGWFDEDTGRYRFQVWTYSRSDVETLWDVVDADARHDYLDVARELRADARPDPCEYEDDRSSR